MYNPPKINDSIENKKLFAAKLLRNPDDPFQAALEVFGADRGAALYASSNWPKDPEVMALIEAAKAHHGEAAFLPTKSTQAWKLWAMANDEKIPIEDRLRAHRLFADICGHIEQKGVTINNNLTQNRVMVVKSHESPEEWERGLAEQQSKLIEDAQYSVQ